LTPLVSGIVHAQEKFRKAAVAVPGEYLIAIVEPTNNENSERASALGIGRALVVANGGTVVTMWSSAVLGIWARMSEAGAKAVSTDPRVLYVEENALGGVVGSQTVDDGLGYWGLDRIDQRSLPLDSTYSYALDGSYLGAGGQVQQVHAYVIDGAVLSSHDEFQKTAPLQGIGDGTNAVAGLPYDEYTPCYCGEDLEFHGTFVAALIAGNSYGVAKNAMIHAVRATDCCGNATGGSITTAANWIKDHHQSPAVANISLEISPSSMADTAVQNLINSGVPVVVGSINAEDSACNYTPSHVGTAIVAGGTDENDTRPTASAYGSCLTVFAPGWTLIRSATALSHNSASLDTGNSFAAAYVSGVSALYLSQQLYATPYMVKDFIVRNATANIVSNAGPSSPNVLLYSRWNQHWYWIGTEDCYADFGNSCYSHVWTPSCPARPVDMKACSTVLATCWSIQNANYVQEYQCSGQN